MATYFFDVHNVGAAEWDDNGSECIDEKDVERRARELAQEFSGQHDGGMAPVTVTVFDQSAKIVLTVIDDKAEGVRLVWS